MVYTLLTGNDKNELYTVIDYHFSHVHASFWLGIEQCAILQRQFLVPDESSAGYAWHTYQKLAPEKWSQFLAPVSAACVMGITVCLCTSDILNLTCKKQLTLLLSMFLLLSVTIHFKVCCFMWS